MSRDQHRARCASDKNPDWPLWYVEFHGLNVLKTGRMYGGKLDTREFCEAEAERLNLETGQ